MSAQQDPLSAVIASLDGAVVPGGCDRCHAEQVIQANVAPGVHLIRVRHDPHCPAIAAPAKRATARKRKGNKKR